MAESTNMGALPNEILRKIVFYAASEVDEDTGEDQFDHEFLVDVISQVCTRFKDIASDP